MGDTESGIYMNMNAPSEDSFVTYAQPKFECHHDKFRLKVDYIRDLRKTKECLVAIKKCMFLMILIINLGTALIATICVMIANKSYSSLGNMIESETQSLYSHLGNLYQTCRDRDTGADLISRVVTQVDALRSEIPTETVRLLIKLMDQIESDSNGMIKLKNQDFFMLQLDKGEGLTIRHNTPHHDAAKRTTANKIPMIDQSQESVTNIPEMTPPKKRPCTRELDPTLSTLPPCRDDPNWKGPKGRPGENMPDP